MAPPDTVSRPAILIVLLIGAAAALTSVLIAWRTFDLIPHVSDEIAYDFQARIFASGRLALTPPEPVLPSTCNM